LIPQRPKSLASLKNGFLSQLSSLSQATISANQALPLWWWAVSRSLSLARVGSPERFHFRWTEVAEGSIPYDWGVPLSTDESDLAELHALASEYHSSLQGALAVTSQ